MYVEYEIEMFHHMHSFIRVTFIPKKEKKKYMLLARMSEACYVRY